MNAIGSTRREIDFSIYHPFSPEFVHNPYPVWDKLNHEFPVAWHRDLGVWVISRHDLNMAYLRDPRLSNSVRDWSQAPAEKPADQRDAFDEMMDHSLFMLPHDQHIRMRKLTFPAFARNVMDQIEATIGGVIDDVFDRVKDRDLIDAAAEIAAQIPVRAITEMVGVPLDARELFEHGFVHNMVLFGNPLYPEDQRMQAMKGTLPGIQLLLDLIAERRARAEPGKDFLGTLVGTVVDGDRLTDMEIVSLVGALIIAGADTAVDLHTGAIMELLSHPEQRALLQREPERMDAAVQEILRRSSPGKTGLYRFALEDIEIEGQTIRKGDAVMMALTAAWNDPARWPDPRKLDITRNVDLGLIFGIGPHFCLGQALVIAQGKLMINALNRYLPNAEIAGEPEYDYMHHNARRMVKLPLRANR